MIDKKQIDLSETNMANFGSELEKNIKHAASLNERAWDGAGQAPGLDIWRIEKFNVVPWPKDQYGSFYSGDSYIVLHTYKKEGQDSLHWNAHMWVGEFTTQDEAGTAAYKIVELDDLFHRQIVLFREVQGFECDLFLSYFQVIKIMEGGIESGFKHVPVEQYRPRLIEVKGRNKKFRCREVPLLPKSLNSHDVFILDNGLTLYNWKGKNSNPFERFKASSITNSIKEERQSRPKVIDLDEGNENDEFWSVLGGKSDITTEKVRSEERPFEKLLFQLSDSSGTLEMKEIARAGNAKRQLLNSEDVFIFDIGFEIYVWVGNGSTTNEKRNSLQYVQNYMIKNNRPLHLPICSLKEGRETDSFLNSFDA